MYKDMYSRQKGELPIRSWQLKDLSSQKRATLQEPDRANEVECVFFLFVRLFDLPLRKHPLVSCSSVVEH